jgi:hypothetical protein
LKRTAHRFPPKWRQPHSKAARVSRAVRRSRLPADHPLTEPEAQVRVKGCNVSNKISKPTAQTSSAPVNQNNRGLRRGGAQARRQKRPAKAAARPQDLTRTPRRQHLALHLHRCGPRPVLKALLAVAGGHDLDATLEDFARLPPETYKALGADALPIR